MPAMRFSIAQKKKAAVDWVRMRNEEEGGRKTTESLVPLRPKVGLEVVGQTHPSSAGEWQAALGQSASTSEVTGASTLAMDPEQWVVAKLAVAVITG